jgi:uncharacterized protein YegL
MTKVANKIVHAAIVLDASGSMQRLSSKVEEVADRLIRDLKTQSEELDLETRISVYTFSYHHQIKCLIFDKDVFRLPSIKGLYVANGQTALIDATILSQTDLAATAQMYGEHNFITYVVTDGYENDSHQGAHVLSNLIARQSANWSLACLVPDRNARDYAVSAGFAPNNILIWDATSAAGLEKAAAQIKESTQSYMTSVSRGVAIDKNNVFGTGVDKVNASTVKANLVPLTKGSYQVWDVDTDTRIDLFVQSKGWTFHVGKGHYQLTGRSVLVQANKKILVLEKSTGLVYGGAEARALVGLPQGVDARVKADANPDYMVLSQSTANNRKLLKGTKFVYVA